MDFEPKCALAGPNIALIKYWGNRDHSLRLPSNSSLSMTLAGLGTRTTVAPDPNLAADEFTLNGNAVNGPAFKRVSEHLNLLRELSGHSAYARVDSENDFPSAAGIASSASAFAALTMSACAAYGLVVDKEMLSRLARRGSGSAARSIFPGYVLLNSADSDQGCFAEPFAPCDHWPLHNVIAIVESRPKHTGSTRGHALAPSSPLQALRLQGASDRLARCRAAIQARDFERLAVEVELDTTIMHAVMLTSTPGLLYWNASTLYLMRAVSMWRQSGIPVCYSVDAGPNVHCLCEPDQAGEVEQRLRDFPEVVDVIHTRCGEGARLV